MEALLSVELFLEYIKLLYELAQYGTVNLICVAGHCGIIMMIPLTLRGVLVEVIRCHLRHVYCHFT